MPTVYMNSHIQQIPTVNNTTEEFARPLAKPPDEAQGRLWQYILAFFAGTVLVGTLTGLHILEKRKTAIAYWQDQQLTIADDRARQISNWLGRHRADTELLSSYLPGKELPRPVEKLGSSGASQTGALQHLSVLMDQFASTYGYAGIYLVNPEGRVVAQSANSASVSPAVIERGRAVSQVNAFWVGPLGETQANSFVYIVSPVFARVGAGLVPALDDHKGRPSLFGCLGLANRPQKEPVSNPDGGEGCHEER